MPYLGKDILVDNLDGSYTLKVPSGDKIISKQEAIAMKLLPPDEQDVVAPPVSGIDNNGLNLGIQRIPTTTVPTTLPTTYINTGVSPSNIYTGQTYSGPIDKNKQLAQQMADKSAASVQPKYIDRQNNNNPIPTTKSNNNFNVDLQKETKTTKGDVITSFDKMDFSGVNTAQQMSNAATDLGEKYRADLSATKASSYKEKVAAQEEMIKKDIARQQAYDAESKRLIDAMSSVVEENKKLDGTIDPKRYWANQSTEEKIGMAFAVGLSGLAGGISGKGGNQVWDMVQSAINNDILAQRETFNNKLAKGKNDLEGLRTIYGSFREKNMDDRVATAATNILMLDKIQTDLDQKVAGMGTQEAAAWGAEQKAKIATETEKLKAQINKDLVKKTVHTNMTDTIENSQTAQVAKAKAQHDINEKNNERTIIVNGKPVYAPLGSVEGINKTGGLREIASNYEPFISKLDQIKALSKDAVLAKLPFTEVNARLETILGESAADYIKGSGLGAYDEGLRALLKRMLPSPTDFFSIQTAAKIDQLKHDFTGKYVSLLQQHGIPTYDLDNISIRNNATLLEKK